MAKFSDISIQAEEVNFKHVEYNQMGEDKLSVRSVGIYIKDEKFICGLSEEKDFLEFNSTQIISQKLNVTLSEIGLFLTN